MMPERPMPPVMADVRRPHLSASKKAGTEMTSINIPDTPDARNDEVAEDIPACENSRGAYYGAVSMSVTQERHMLNIGYSRKAHRQYQIVGPSPTRKEPRPFSPGTLS